jgi:hypothetical protein
MATVVQLANQNLEDAGIAVGKGGAMNLSFNRHTIRPDGTAVTSYRLPPKEDNLAFGPIDPEVGVVRVDSLDGAPIATLINFACHPVCGVDRMYAISADYPGHAMGMVEKELGGICMFMLGCAGNIVPIEREGLSREKIGLSLAAEVIKTWQWLQYVDRCELGSAQKVIELPLKKPRKDEITRQVEIQALGIDGMSLIGLPGEVFVEIGAAIKGGTRAENVFPVSLANGSPGYVPVSIAYDQGGYESNSSPFAKGSGEILTEEALGLLGRDPQ